jgi:hypothetical protein
VLNYASLADCQRYSSLSRVSAEVEAADGGDDDGRGEAEHPVVSVLGQRAVEETDAPDGGMPAEDGRR